MAVRRLPAAILVLGACTSALGQGPIPSVVQSAPAARLAPISAPPPAGELPPLLPVPASPPATPPAAASPAGPNDYHPNHVYLPDQNPDCCPGGCDGDCHPCRQAWVDMAFFVGKAENLPNVSRKLLYGFQIGAGYWLTPDRTVGIDVDFFDANGTYRKVETGPVLIDSPVTLVTGDANFRTEVYTHDRLRIDGLAGYRYVQLHEKLLIGAPEFVASLAVRDHIHAGQLGLIANYRYGPYFAEVLGKLAVGRTSEDIDRNGLRVTDTGLCVFGEFGARVAYQFGEALWGTLGYQLLYLSNVDRPSQPDTDYLLHGLTIGFEKRF